MMKIHYQENVDWLKGKDLFFLISSVITSYVCAYRKGFTCARSQATKREFSLIHIGLVKEGR